MWVSSQFNVYSTQMYIDIAEFSKHLKILKVQFVKYDAFYHFSDEPTLTK